MLIVCGLSIGRCLLAAYSLQLLILQKKVVTHIVAEWLQISYYPL